MAGGSQSITLGAIDARSLDDPQLHLALAASDQGVFEPSDVVRIVADLDNDGQADLTVAEFHGGAGDHLRRGGTGRTVIEVFTDFVFDIRETTKQATDLTLRIEVITNNSTEEIGIDSLRVTGKAMRQSLPTAH